MQAPGAGKTRTFHFGSIDNLQAALERYEREWPYHIQGKTAPVVSVENEDVCTLRTLCNAFLESKRCMIDSRERMERSDRDSFRSCVTPIDHFGTDRRVPPDPSD